jgi:hypothetical protein
MTYPGLGGQQEPPQNASPAGQLVPGVQPGVTGQIVASRVIIVGAGGELLVYNPSAGAGNLVVSITGQATTDPFGNQVRQGVADYVTVAGDEIAVQLGLGSFAGTGAAGLFTHDQTHPASSDPFIGATNSSSTACVAVLYSGNTTGLSSGAGIEAEDSVTSGVTGGTVNIVAGQLLFQGATLFNGTTLTVTNANVTGTLTVAGSTSTGGPDSSGFFNTQGLASGSYGSTHQHTLPNFPTATHGHPL